MSVIDFDSEMLNQSGDHFSKNWQPNTPGTGVNSNIPPERLSN
jgi:hypothetical protein